MCTEEFIRMMFTVDLYGNRGLDSRSPLIMLILYDCASTTLSLGKTYSHQM